MREAGTIGTIVPQNMTSLHYPHTIDQKDYDSTITKIYYNASCHLSAHWRFVGDARKPYLQTMEKVESG